jgi:hypothetical protein
MTPGKIIHSKRGQGLVGLGQVIDPVGRPSRTKVFHLEATRLEGIIDLAHPRGVDKVSGASAGETQAEYESMTRLRVGEELPEETALPQAAEVGFD